MSSRNLSRLLTLALRTSHAPAYATQTSNQLITLRSFGTSTGTGTQTANQWLQEGRKLLQPCFNGSLAGSVTQHSMRGSYRMPTLPARRPGGSKRLFSDKAAAGSGSSGAAGSASAQQTAAQRLKSMSEAPGKAFKALTQTVGGQSGATFKQMPTGVRAFFDRAQHSRLRDALGLQAEAFWQHHRRKVLGAGGLLLVYILWKTMFGVTSIFVNLSETMAELGFLAFSAAMVAFAGLYFRHRYTISPKSVYRQAMVRLNTHPSVLEVMGAPLAGSDVRAQVLTGGGLRLKGLVPKYRSRRLQMIFPLRGAEHRGLVSLEAKRRRGKYDFKLLVVDVPAAAGGSQRIYLAGDQRVYDRGSIINELRDPFLQALTLTKVYEEEDEADEAADEAAEEEERRAKEAREAAARPKSMDDGGGMYAYERMSHWVRSKLSSPAASEAAPPAQQSAAATQSAAASTQQAQPSKEAASAPKPI